MLRRVSFLAFCALSGCASPQDHALADLQTEVRTMHQEQERQAHQLEVLENRIVLAEDSARLARQALVGVGARGTVRIAPDGSGGVESIPSATSPENDASDASTIADDPNQPRPLIQATGRGAPPPSNEPPIVVHDDDRLPVVPLPEDSHPPAAPSRGRGPGENRDASPSDDVAPASTVPDDPATPGSSSARDPRSAPAYEHALELARGGRCNEAVDAFSAFLVRWPDHPFADNAMYWRGECILRDGDVHRAASEFEGLLARFPIGDKAPDALFKLVMCYRRLGDATRARRYADRLLREFPRSEVAARLRAGESP